MTSKRVLYLDMLRIFATIGVMVIHITSLPWQKISVASFEWQVFNFLGGMVRWSVPAFVMISGALFLGKENSIAKIYRKNIFHMITAYLFWSVLYAAIEFSQGLSLSSTIVQAVQVHYHMWFLLMIVGLYMIVPFLKKIVESPSLTRYFLLLALICTFAIPQGISLLSLVNENYGGAVNYVWETFDFHFTLGFVGYFVCGYYISSTDFSKKQRMLIYILGLSGIVSTILFSSLLSIHTGKANELFHGSFTINVMLESIGVFVFFKYHSGKRKVSASVERVIVKLSKYSFGAYLVHAMVIEQLRRMGLTSLSIHPLVSVAVITLIVFCVSIAVSWICNHIPKISKYIV